MQQVKDEHWQFSSTTIKRSQAWQVIGISEGREELYKQTGGVDKNQDTESHGIAVFFWRPFKWPIGYTEIT